MTSDDRLNAIADRIADGTAIDWPADSSGTDPDERAVLGELRTISRLATLHREPFPLNATEGESWGPLTITSSIGEGRFGRVYLAWDARLQRRVALKLLFAPAPAASSLPTHAIEEARLLARIRHPNVLAVYGAECLDGQIGIWTEFIEGQTLEAWLRERGPLASSEVVDIGIALCRALGAVHAAGLLHRDIKPQNVMRETGGRIVLMDFGTGHDLSAKPIGAGDLSGTPLYLAPEVIGGAEATQASDLYALAVLLFRLLTGEYPVSGRTLADVRAGHEKGSAARLSDARPEVPARLAKAIDRGLSASPLGRYQTATDFERALEACVPEHSTVIPHSGPIRFWHAAMVLLAATVVVVAAFVFSGTNRFSSNVLAAEWESVPLTLGSNGSVVDVSRDGKKIVYLRGRGEMWIYDIDARKDFRAFAADTVRPQLWAGTLTPDGSSIDMLVMPAKQLWRRRFSESAEPTKIADQVASAPGWSVDGKQMAFLVDSETGRELVVADHQGGSRRSLALRPEPRDFVGSGYMIFPASNRPSWAPDGRTIAIAGLTFGSGQKVLAEILLVDTVTGAQSQEKAFEQRDRSIPQVTQVAWLTSTQLVVSHRPDGWGPYQLSILDLANHSLSRITNDSSSYSGISIAADRQTIVSTTRDESSGIWVIESPATSSSKPLISERRERPRDASFDVSGNLIYTQDTADGPAIWIKRSGSDTPAFVSKGEFPRVTLDGKTIVFVHHDGGLHRSNLSGGQTTRILDGAFGVLNPAAESTVVFLGNPQQSILSVPVAGGTPRMVVKGPLMRPRVSNDGRRLLYRTGKGAMICDLPRCSDLRLVPFQAPLGPSGWTPDNLGVAFTSRESGTDNIWVWPIDGGPVRQVTTFTDDRAIQDFNWSHDGQKLAVTRGSNVPDVVMLKRRP